MGNARGILLVESHFRMGMFLCMAIAFIEDVHGVNFILPWNKELITTLHLTIMRIIILRIPGLYLTVLRVYTSQF